MIDDGGLTQADLDTSGSSLFFYGVSREAMVQIIVLRVSIQESRLQLTLHYYSAMLHSGNVLLWDCNTHNKAEDTF